MFESHYQSFEDLADPSQSAPRVAALRAELARLGLDGFLVPRADQYQNEYVAPSEERLAWLSGFTGSAGLAIVLKTRAAIFVDGRYSLAVKDQVDLAIFKPEALTETGPANWLEKNLKSGARLGYDPWLHTPRQIERLGKAMQAARVELVSVETNPIDAIWKDRPAPPLGKVSLHARKFAGEDAKKKLARVLSALMSRDALLVSDPHAVAWLFNIRGHDVAHTPLPLAYALILKDTTPRLYIHPDKLDKAVHDKLAALVSIRNPEHLAGDLTALGEAHKKVLFNSATAPAKLTQIFAEAGGAE